MLLWGSHIFYEALKLLQLLSKTNNERKREIVIKRDRECSKILTVVNLGKGFIGIY